MTKHPFLAKLSHEESQSWTKNTCVLCQKKTDSRLLTPSTVSKWQSAAVKALCSLHFRLQHNQSVESSRTRPFPRAAIHRTRLYIIPAVWEEHYTLLEVLTLNISLPTMKTEYANNYSYPMTQTCKTLENTPPQHDMTVSIWGELWMQMFMNLRQDFPMQLRDEMLTGLQRFSLKGPSCLSL